MTKIMGVDFSGAKPETGKTWIAEGSLSDDGVLTLNSCHPIIRADLAAKLQSLKDPAVAAMDFPFSVPEVFAKFWHCKRPHLVPYKGDMTHLWDAAHKMERDPFIKFVKEEWRGEPKRTCDLGIQVFSPLRHSNHPSMLQMTIEGMLMLNDLRGKSAVRVPPLHPDPEPDTITLLEIMPGLTLRSLDLPARGYKGGQNPLKVRNKILTELPKQVRVKQLGLNLFPLSAAITLTCRANDDALDAVVAAITAALWQLNRDAFRHPESKEERQAALLEGWLYAPKDLGGNE